MFPLSLFHRKKPAAAPSVLISAERQQHRDFSLLRQDETAQQLYRQLRYAVPIIDAALSKIIRLTGSYSVIASDPSVQKQLDAFVQQIPCDFSSQAYRVLPTAFSTACSPAAMPSESCSLTAAADALLDYTVQNPIWSASSPENPAEPSFCE